MGRSEAEIYRSIGHKLRRKQQGSYEFSMEEVKLLREILGTYRPKPDGMTGKLEQHCIAAMIKNRKICGGCGKNLKGYYTNG